MKVGLDVDGVLADFYLSMCERYGQPYCRLDSWAAATFIDGNTLGEVSDDHDFWKTLKILNPPTFVDFDFDYYITSVPDGMKEAREYWLKVNGYPDKPVIVAEDKVTACRLLGVTILIDDKPSTLDLFKSEDDLIGIQYVPPYSDMGTWGDHSVTCLSEINKLLTAIKGG